MRERKLAANLGESCFDVGVCLNKTSAIVVERLTYWYMNVCKLVVIHIIGAEVPDQVLT